MLFLFQNPFWLWYKIGDSKLICSSPSDLDKRNTLAVLQTYIVTKKMEEICMVIILLIFAKPEAWLLIKMMVPCDGFILSHCSIPRFEGSKVLQKKFRFSFNRWKFSQFVEELIFYQSRSSLFIQQAIYYSTFEVLELRKFPTAYKTLHAVLESFYHL